MILLLQVLLSDSSGYGMRFSEIQRELSWVSPKVLTQRLRELEFHELVNREVDASSIPPHVSYSLTPKGSDLKASLVAMQEWGRKHGGTIVADCPGQGFDGCSDCQA